MKLFFFAVVFLLGHITLLAVASAGDRSDLFQRCVFLCRTQKCPAGNDQPSINLPLSLRLTRWTCADDCAYSCMHQITDSAVANGQLVVQYFGKWPFWRLFGMQEPASVLFSLLNFWVHWRGYEAVKRIVPDRHPIRSFLLLWSVVNMNAWICSAIFHVRDKPMTEKLDYFSAALIFITALHTVVSRFFFIGRPSRRYVYKFWSVSCVLAYITHVSYLSSLERFNYSYNIIFNLVIGLAHNLLWLLYSLPASTTVVRRFPPRTAARDYRPKCASQAALGVAFTMAAMSLELLDFAPVGRVLDAHALWHAATVPIAEFWYRFLIADALDDGWKPDRV